MGMISSAGKVLGPLQWIQRRHVFLLCSLCAVMYLILFHDVHRMVAASSAALSKTIESPLSVSTSWLHPSSASGQEQDQDQSPQDPGSEIKHLDEQDRYEATKAKHPHHPIIPQPPISEEIQDEEPMRDDDGSLPPDFVPVDEYVALCLAVKDQAKDMVEFFTHHYHHAGIKRFYVME